MTITHHVERLVDTNDFITIGLSRNLSTGETISGTPTVTANNSAVAVIPGTISVSSDGKSISARFRHDAAGTTRIDLSFNTNLSGVVKKSYIIIDTVYPPDDGTVVITPTQDQAALLDARLDRLEDLFYIVTNYGVLPDNSAADNSTALQNLLDTVPENAILLFPPHEFSFTSDLITTPDNSAITFEGMGWYLANRPSFGSAGWEAPFITISGTILRCTSTSGVFIRVGSSSVFNMRNLLLRGTGSNTQTTTGVQTAGSAVDGLNYIDYLVSSIWDNVAFCNFKIGVRFFTVYQSHFKDLRFFGCDTGAQAGVRGTIDLPGQGMVTSVITNLDTSGCRIVWQADNMGDCTFIGPTVQGVVSGGKGFLFNYYYNVNMISPFFENGVTIGSGYAIDLVEGNTFYIENGVFQTALDVFRIGELAGAVVYNAGGGMNSTIVNGFTVRIHNGNAGYVTGGQLWSYVEEFTDASSLTHSIYVPTYTFPVDANRRGGLRVKNGDLILSSPDATIYRIDVANNGGLRIKDKNFVNKISMGVWQTGSFSATPTIDASAGDVFELTLTGNVTSSTISNASKGMLLQIILIQDGVGGRTFAWPTNVKLAGGAVALSSANKRDSITLRYDGTNWYEIARALNL